jgi:hypothetical protein
MKKSMLFGALICTVAIAQETRTVQRFQIADGIAGDGQMVGAAIAAPGPDMPGQFFFARTEMAFDGATVKGAPYSADAVTDMTQTLADGNRIHRTTQASLYRDSEGRTRREQTLGELGPVTASGEPLRTIVIHDPVSGTTYMLDSRSKIAHKMPAKGEMVAKMTAELKARTDKEFVRTEAPGVIMYSTAGGESRMVKPEIKTEQLGAQTIEGVPADGTRSTMTIPAGAIGNDQPINVVTERWYSSQLKTTIMTRTSDPRMGETVYKLQNIKLAEPDPSLFTVPSDYTVQ